VPRDRPIPPPFEPEWLERSLNRFLAAGLVFMTVLVAGFGVYRAREPTLRATARREQLVTYVTLGAKLYADNCASCHGKDGVGADGPRLNAREFLTETSDDQMRLLIAGGVSGTAMPTWSIDLGGTLTDQQIRQVITYIRTWERDAPSVPDWRQGDTTQGGDHEH
jgi:mono/diheme cytochrome c family protein